MQITIITKPELRAFWGDSLNKQPFGSAEVAIICPENLYIQICSMYIYIYLEPVCPLFWWLNPPKQGLNSNQNKGPHLGSRYVYANQKVH